MILILKKQKSFWYLIFVCLISIFCFSCNNSTKKSNNLPKPDISEAKDAYCWLKTDGAQMYATTDINSSKYWQFSKGEVLAVLDSKATEKNGAVTSWLQVKFTGNIKGGYEDLLTINTAPSDGQHKGWIEGTVENSLNCR